MDEALEWAADYAERNKLFEGPVNKNGYTMDGWKSPTAVERVQIITDLARTVTSPLEDVTSELKLADVATLCSHGAVLCALCNFIPDSWRPLV